MNIAEAPDSTNRSTIMTFKKTIASGIAGVVLSCLLAWETTLASVPVEIRIIGYNLQSNFSEANPTMLAERIAFMEDYDLWGFCEVAPEWAEEIEWGVEQGEEADFHTVQGSTGGNIRLSIVFDSSLFDHVSTQELQHINQGNHRAPLVARLRIQSTGDEFFFMVNHLARGDSQLRHDQASKLNEWASQQSIPVIAVGDYNYDWHYRNGDANHDQGFDNMVENDVFTWLRPKVLIRTQHSNFDSVLDFVFIANFPATWESESRILYEPGDFPDSDESSDHRPIEAVIQVLD